VTTKLLKEIDAAIARLQSVRAMVKDEMAAANRGTKTQATRTKTAKKSTRKHGTMSEEGRERIRQAQLKRWAKARRTAKKASA
jgi:hypothetical protein